MSTEPSDPAPTPPSPRRGPPRFNGSRWFDQLREKQGLRLALLIAIPVLLLGPFTLERLLYRDRPLRGVWAGELAMTGLPHATALELWKAKEERLGTKARTVRVAEQLIALEPREIGLRIDGEKTWSLVLAEGREGSLWQQYVHWWQSWRTSRVVIPAASWDEAAIATRLDDWERSAIPDPPDAGGIEVAGNKVGPRWPKDGRVIDRPAALAVLRRELAVEQTALIDLPLTTLRPKTTKEAVEAAVREAEQLLSSGIRLTEPGGKAELRLSASHLRQAFRTRLLPDGRLEPVFDATALADLTARFRRREERPARSATFEVDKFGKLQLVPEQPGMRLLMDQLPATVLTAARTRERTAALPVDRGEKPRLNAADVEKLAPFEKLIEFRSAHPCCQPRVQNIHRIADLISGTIVLPGERFSVNETIGPRDAAHGFVSAPSIVEGEMEDTVGGGVSQFATALFNAVYRAGLEVLERQPHSYWFERYPMGIEATLSFPKPDLVFRNDSDHALLILCRYDARSVVVSLYGDLGKRRVTVHAGPRIEPQAPPLELEVDDSVPPEKEKLAYGGMAGWSLMVSRTITYADGQTKGEERKVTYRPRARVLRVHSCRIPEGMRGYTGKPCPLPEAETAAETDDAAVEADAPAPEEEAPQGTAVPLR